MIDWEKEFDSQFANNFLNEKYMDNLELGERVKTFIQRLLHEQYERYDYLTDTMEKNLRLDKKEIRERIGCSYCKGTGCCFEGGYVGGEIQEPEPCDVCRGTGKDCSLRLDEKELDKILKDFYEHMCGVDDYGCDLCLKYKQQIVDLQGEK